MRSPRKVLETVFSLGSRARHDPSEGAGVGGSRRGDSYTTRSAPLLPVAVAFLRNDTASPSFEYYSFTDYTLPISAVRGLENAS